MQQTTAAVIIVIVISVISSNGAYGAPAYPKFCHVFIDPGTYDLLYNAASGPINETLRLTRSVRLTSVVVPSQVIDFAGHGSYEEDLTVKVYQTVLNSNHALDKTTLVASGSFLGKVRYGQEVHVPVHVVLVNNGTSSSGDEPPTMAVFIHTEAGSQYTVSFSFGKAGIYPWYNKRKLSSSATVHNSCDVAGFMIGLAYTLV